MCPVTRKSRTAFTVSIQCHPIRSRPATTRLSPGFQPVPTGPAFGAEAARDAHVPIDVLRGDDGEAGSFTLTTSGLGGGTTTDPTGPDPGETDSCGEVISGERTTDGQWATGCGRG